MQSKTANINCQPWKFKDQKKSDLGLSQTKVRPQCVSILCPYLCIGWANLQASIHGLRCVLLPSVVESAVFSVIDILVSG